MSLTDRAIEQIRELIQSGALVPGAKLPPEASLAAELGLSRNLTREAVKALAVAGVLDIRRGDGTYVTSLKPGILLGGLGGAVDLLQSDPRILLELIEVRRLLEPAATALAATRMTDRQLATTAAHLQAMKDAGDDIELLNRHDAAFHHAVIAAAGNDSLTAVLDGIAGRTLRARIWRGLGDHHSTRRTIAEHEAILDALTRHDAAVSHAAALLHVSSIEHWLREHLGGSAATDPAMGG